MKKIKCEFGGGTDTLLFDIVTKEFFSYEKNNNVLHEKFGGKQYYTSRTGLSGAGYIPVTNQNPLIKFGYYRIDIHKIEQKPEMVAKDLWGYAPIRSHEGIDLNKPFILTNGVDRIAYCPVWKICDLVEKWKRNHFSFEEKTIYYFTSEGQLEEKIIYFNNSRYAGIDFLRFLNLTDIQPKIKEEEDFDFLENPLYAVMHIKKNKHGYFHKNKWNFFDGFWETNPLVADNEVEGYLVINEHMIFRREGNYIAVVIEKAGNIFSHKYHLCGLANKITSDLKDLKNILERAWEIGTDEEINFSCEEK